MISHGRTVIDVPKAQHRNPGPTPPRREFGTRVPNLRTAGFSHLLAADDALAPGRWGVHVTLCGQQVRGPNPGATEDGDRYCPECVSEAVRWSASAYETEAHSRSTAAAMGSWPVEVR